MIGVLRWCAWGLVCLGCSSNETCPDGGTCADATVDVAQVLGSFSSVPASMILDPGDVGPVVVTVIRGTVTGNIAITVTGLPTGVTVTPLTIMPSSSVATFNVQAATTAPIPQDATLTITATAGTTPLTATMHLHLGSVFHTTTSNESFIVPGGQMSLVFQVWGAGGGAGGSFGAPGVGGVGGGGGFATAEVTTTPGETLNLVVGGGGSAGMFVPVIAGSGGGGGGYSAVLRGTTVLVIAGGGGGGGGGGYDLATDAGGASGFAGGGGGGFSGENGLGSCAGFGATDAGVGSGGLPGGQGGMALTGGGGGCDSVCTASGGGTPGGGGGGIGSTDGGGAGGGGGGGAGWLGGGGGGAQTSLAGYGCGGGGGSAFISQGASQKLITATGQMPAGTSVVGYADSGAAVGGALSDAGNPSPGVPGLIAVAYPK